jgi:hypothetical protein
MAEHEVADDDVDERRARCEVLAGLSAAGAASVVLYGILQAIATAMASGGPQGGPGTWDLVTIAAGTSVLFPTQSTGMTAHALLLLAYLLVIHIGPGSRIGATGERALQGVVAVGALMVVGGVILTSRLVTEQSSVESSFSVPPSFEGDGGWEPDIAVSVVARGGTVLPILVGIALAGYLAGASARSFLDAAIDAVDGPDGLDDDADGLDEDALHPNG